MNSKEDSDLQANAAELPFELLEKNRPQQQRAIKTYETILESAAQLLEEIGVERISTNLIAERAGQSVGYILAAPKTEDDPLAEEGTRQHIYIADLYIAAGYRGQGIGRALMSAVEQHFAPLGHDCYRVGALARNSQARGLYESLGFEAREVLYEKRKG